ncbi:MAG: OmpH family outer membrane protein [Bacteroidota bacterium]|jgi:outer membrane protein|nr:OmpH family outer membrane protein [Bacteroidota bacterium]
MKKITLLAALFGTFISASYAQNKLGYINSRELLEVMPEVKKADSSLQIYAKSFQDQLESMSKEYESKVKDFQANEKTMNEAVKEVKVKEVQQLQERMETLQQSAQEKTAKRREEMYKPILEKADKAIKDVAKENKYDYIFDASGGAILFAKDSDNVLSLVKTKLGIK